LWGKNTVVTSATEIGKATAIFSMYTLGCSSCSSVIERKLKRVPGIIGVDVSYVTDTVLVEYDSARVTFEDIQTFLKKVGHYTTHQ
jgi:copper chaperone CopZ